MASQQLVCTDEELVNELEKLGYYDVPPDVLEMMQNDLTKLVEKDEHHFPPSLNSIHESDSTRIKLPYRLSQEEFDLTAINDFQPRNRDISVEPSSRQNSPDNSASSVGVSKSRKESAFTKYRSSLNKLKSRRLEKELLDVLESQAKAEEEPDPPLVVSTNSGLDSSSVSVTENKMKRKILRHKDGKAVISEKLVDTPCIFNTSYPETQSLESSEIFSSDDLLCNSSSSMESGSTLNLSDSPGTSRTGTYSYSPRSVHSRLVNVRRKKNDPVSMFNYYKKFWNNFKPPGEKTHDKLRWAVRDKMLDYHL